MIPSTLITASLEFATEGLRAFNSLDAEQRRAIVQRLLDDDAARRRWWANVTAWFTVIAGKVKLV